MLKMQTIPFSKMLLLISVGDAKRNAYSVGSTYKLNDDIKSSPSAQSIANLTMNLKIVGSNGTVCIFLLFSKVVSFNLSIIRDYKCIGRKYIEENISIVIKQDIFLQIEIMIKNVF